jgi:hypothetical protein
MHFLIKCSAVAQLAFKIVPLKNAHSSFSKSILNIWKAKDKVQLSFSKIWNAILILHEAFSFQKFEKPCGLNV